MRYSLNSLNFSSSLCLSWAEFSAKKNVSWVHVISKPQTCLHWNALDRTGSNKQTNEHLQNPNKHKSSGCKRRHGLRAASKQGEFFLLQIQMHKTKTFRLQEKAWLRWWVQPITRGRTSPPRSTSTRFPTPGSSSFMKIETGMQSIFVGWRNLSLPWNRFCHRLRWALTQQISCENFDIKSQ